MKNFFGDSYHGKTVLVTGHTGFKGSWLTMRLTHLGANVVGYSQGVLTKPCLFDVCQPDKRVTHLQGDIRDFALLAETIKNYRPEVIFHLAAQAQVRFSFKEPLHTFEVNLMGTINVLEAARRADSVKAVVIVSSDKCYRNVGGGRKYRETDELGGHDPYSASKACVELATAVYQDSRFSKLAEPPAHLPIASVRSGNVIGGGDWASDRIIPDIVRAISSENDVILRNPKATRPWQHVLEPLSGYLWLAPLIIDAPERFCSAWNFGPREERMLTVAEVASRILERWGPCSTRCIESPDDSGAEALQLHLDCSKAAKYLGWHATWDIDTALDATVSWYKRFYERSKHDMYEYSLQQIDDYSRLAITQKLPWTTLPSELSIFSQNAGW